MSETSTTSRGESAPLSCPNCSRKSLNSGKSKPLDAMDYFLAKKPPTDLITLEEMSTLVNRSVSTLRVWAKSDEFPNAVTHRGRIVGFSRYEYEQWLACK